MTVQKAEQLIVHNETVADSDPGQEFQGAGRMNFVSHITNDGANPILVSFDAPHPVSNPIEIASGESLNDFPVPGGFRSVFIRGSGGTSTIRVLATYDTRIPDRFKEVENRDGNLENLREIKELLGRSDTESPNGDSETTVDVALRGESEPDTDPAMADISRLLPIILIGAAILTFAFGSDG